MPRHLDEMDRLRLSESHYRHRLLMAQEQIARREGEDRIMQSAQMHGVLMDEIGARYGLDPSVHSIDVDTGSITTSGRTAVAAQAQAPAPETRQEPPGTDAPPG